MSLEWVPMQNRSLPTLVSGSCDVWLLSLKQSVLPYENLLSAEEKVRAGQYVLPQIRDRFIVARGLMRQYLSHYSGEAPEDLVFSVTSTGKPYLATHPHLYFNLSHSAARGVFAVTTAGPVGVDIEAVNDRVDSEGLVDRYFSSTEQQQFSALSPHVKKAAFFNGWCAKEAWVKAHGSTLLEGFKHCHVRWGERGEVQGGEVWEQDRHEGYALPCIEGYASHCVVLGRVQTWRCYC